MGLGSGSGSGYLHAHGLHEARHERLLGLALEHRLLVVIVLPRRERDDGRRDDQTRAVAQLVRGRVGVGVRVGVEGLGWGWGWRLG